jgi:hypothetical protein
VTDYSEGYEAGRAYMDETVDRLRAALEEAKRERDAQGQRAEGERLKRLSYEDRLLGALRRVDELMDPIVRAKRLEPPPPFYLTDAAGLLLARAEKAETALQSAEALLATWKERRASPLYGTGSIGPLFSAGMATEADAMIAGLAAALLPRPDAEGAK